MAAGETEQGLWLESDMARRRRRERSCRREHAGVFWRFFFLHSSRSERLMDGLGFFTTVLSALGGEWRRSPEAKMRARAHLGYFNGGVYLAPAVAGAVVNLERRRASGERISAERIERVKTALSSVLAARGNRFFDALLIPLGLTIAALFAMYSSYIGLVVFLALYNYYHFQSRIGGYCRGVELGEDVGGAFVTRLFREARFLEGIAAFASGVFTALLFMRAFDAGGAPFAAAGVAGIAAVAVLRRRLSPTAAVCITAAALTLFLVATSFVAMRAM